MEALRDKFAAQSNSVRRAFREVAQPGYVQQSNLSKCNASRQDRIRKAQIRRLLHSLNLMGVAPKVLTELFNMMDVDGNGSIDYREFKEAFGEGICGGGYEGMDVFHGEKTHRANVADRSRRGEQRDMELESAIRELRTRMSTQHTKVRTAFRALDRDSSGALDREELLALLQNYHIKLSECDMNKLIARIDTDNSGKISYREFNNYFGADIAGGSYRSAAMRKISSARDIKKDAEAQKRRSQEHHKSWTTGDFMNAMESILMTRARTVRRIFRVADSDKSGCIDVQEWQNALRQMNLEMPPDKAKEFFDALDKNGDGHINYREFVAAFGDIVAGFRDTGIMTAHLNRQARAKEFGNSMPRPCRVPRVPRYTVDQIKEIVAKRLGGKYTSARAAFRNIDLDKGGTLDKSEFRRFIQSLNVELTEEDYEMLYRELDRDNNGSIDYKEFLFWFGEAICGAPWQAIQSTGLCTAGVPYLANKMPEPALLSSKEALRLLHLKLTEMSTSVNKVFKRYNKGRSTTLSRRQFRLMFDNYHLNVTDATVLEILKHMQRSHDVLPANGNGLSFPLFVKEFGKSIVGEAFVGVVNSESADFCKKMKPTPKCTAKQARAMLIDKLATNFKHSRTAFAHFNLARDNVMTTAELRSALTHYHIHLSDDEFTKFATDFVKDDSGVIDFKKFTSAVGGTKDSGLSVKMQEADDLQKAKLKVLHRELENQSFENTDSESDTDKKTSDVNCQEAKDGAAVSQLSAGIRKGQQQVLTTALGTTVWDIKGKQIRVESTRLVHRKHWRIPPSRPLPRVVSEPLVISNRRN